MKSLAQIAYEAYATSTGGVSAVTNDRLPLWEQLEPRVQEAWGAAAGAVADIITPGGNS